MASCETDEDSRAEPAFGEKVAIPAATGGRRRRPRVDAAQPIHCHRAHCTVTRPRPAALTATIPECTFGRPPRAASARKSGKIVTPKRGRERSGQPPRFGELRGISRLAVAKRPYTAPKRRQATTVRKAKPSRKSSACTLNAAVRSV